MAVYSGNCGSLTLLQCDTDSSTNGLMPYLNLTGLTPGTTIFIRFWESGNDVFGTFSICLSTDCTSGNGAGSTSISCPNIISGSPTEAGTFKYYITPENQCNTAPIDSGSIVINALPLKPSITSVGPSSFCIPGTDTLSTSAQNGLQ